MLRAPLQHLQEGEADPQLHSSAFPPPLRHCPSQDPAQRPTTARGVRTSSEGCKQPERPGLPRWDPPGGGGQARGKRDKNDARAPHKAPRAPGFGWELLPALIPDPGRHREIRGTPRSRKINTSLIKPVHFCRGLQLDLRGEKRYSRLSWLPKPAAGPARVLPKTLVSSSRRSLLGKVASSPRSVFRSRSRWKGKLHPKPHCWHHRSLSRALSPVGFRRGSDICCAG